MALHLNLNHEIEKAKAVSRRDPLKLTMYALGGVVALFALNFFVKLGTMASLNHDLDKKRGELADLQPKADAAVKLKAELEKKFTISDKMVRRIEGRFYWSPLLEELMRSVPANIQVTRLGADCNGEPIKRISINLDCVAAGINPRKVAEDFRTHLNDLLSKNYRNVAANFRGGIEVKAGETIEVEGKATPTAAFAINIQLTSGEDAKTPPPARVPKSR